jgi:transposase
MNGKRKQYTGKFKARVALDAIKGEKTITELSSLYGVHPNQITKWKRQAVEILPELLSNNRHKAEKDSEALQDELYRQIGQLKVELDWLKKKSGLNY